MASGHEYSTALKEVFFRVITFVEAEKNGPQIPLYKTTQRIQTMLGISERSVFNLKQEMKNIKDKEEAERQKKEEEETKKKEETIQMQQNVMMRLRPRSSTTESSISSPPDQISVDTSPSASHRKQHWETSVPKPHPPMKQGHSGRSPLILSEQAQDAIRYQFHLMITEKVYPTTKTLLARLLAEYNDFPVRSVTTLWRQMRQLGFSYKSTTKSSVLLDGVSFVAHRASYFRRLDELRASGARIYYHDETWLSAGEEKRSIWVDAQGKGRLRKQDGQGRRIAISAMIGSQGFVEPIDIWHCDKDHTMNSERFHKWIEYASSRLRINHGPNQPIAIIIDNAPWHNILCDDAKPPKRAWTKSELQKWLTGKNIAWDIKMSKAELVELAFANIPTKRYVTNEIARTFDVEILRLPIKHCTLNPIELAWAQLKYYVRNKNVNFRLSDVEDAALEFIGAVDEDASKSFIEHTYKVETTFKAADAIVENHIEPQLVETDKEDNSDPIDDDDSDISE